MNSSPKDEKKFTIPVGSVIVNDILAVASFRYKLHNSRIFEDKIVNSSQETCVVSEGPASNAMNDFLTVACFRYKQVWRKSQKLNIRSFNAMYLNAVWTLTILALYVIAKENHGIKMTDHFSGFRFKLTGHVQDAVGIRNAIQAKADKLACFGWVQDNFQTSISGEVKCNKRNGKKFREFLLSKDFNPVISFDTTLNDYNDTKSKLQFVDFEFFDRRETCFRDSPHLCDEIMNGSSLY